MADRRADQLIAAGAVAGTDILYLEQDPAGAKLPRKIAVTDMAAAVASVGGLATTAYVDNAVVGLWDDRGDWDASGNVFPSTGGSGPAGAIKKADTWFITVAGTLGGTAIKPGDVIIARTDTPGQTAGNWVITNHDLGYVPADDSFVVHKALTETVTGQKTFNLRPITSEQAVFNSIPVDGTTDASATLAALDATPNDVETLVISKGQTLYVNTNLTLTNIELDVKKGGLIKVGTGHTFKAPIRNPGLRTILDVTGTPGVFVPTNQRDWHYIWWGPVNTADDSATQRRAYAAAGPLSQVFSSLPASGQRYIASIGISKVADVDVPSGCDIVGTFGGSMVGLASTAVAYGLKFGAWSGIQDCFVHSLSVTGKTVLWLDANRCYAYRIYGIGDLGETGRLLRVGHLLRTITDGAISGGTTLTSAAQAGFTTADNGKVVTGTGIPGGTTLTVVSPTVATLSAVSTNGAVMSIVIAGSQFSLSVKLTDLWLLGSGTGTGLTIEASDVEWSNVMTGTFGRNIDILVGGLTANGCHTWGATTDGLRAQAVHGVRLTNFYAETNGTGGLPGGTPTGWWGADFTGSDRCVIDAYFVWYNANGVKFSASGTRVITDGVISGGTTLTSAAQALFSAADVNMPVVAAGSIPAGTTILSYSADGLTAVLSAVSTNGAVASITLGSSVSATGNAALGHGTNNVVGDGIFDDNVDTGLELSNSVATSVMGANFGSLAIGGIARRGIHAGRGCTATIRAKGANSYFTQKLKIDDSQGGLDIELGRKRISAAEYGTADYTDQAVVFQTMVGFAVAANDEWDIRFRVTCNGSQGSDARVRIIPSALGTGADGRVGLIGAPAVSNNSPTAATMVAANVSRLNVTTPATMSFGTVSILQEQMIAGEGRYKAGSVTGTDNVNLNVQCASFTAQGARGVPSVSDAVFNGTTTITSATAAFVASDVGRIITGTGIPANTYIASLTNGTTIVLSQATTANGSSGTPTNNTITIGVGQTTFLAADTIIEAVRRG